MTGLLEGLFALFDFVYGALRRRWTYAGVLIVAALIAALVVLPWLAGDAAARAGHPAGG